MDALCSPVCREGKSGFTLVTKTGPELAFWGRGEGWDNSMNRSPSFTHYPPITESQQPWPRLEVSGKLLEHTRCSFRSYKVRDWHWAVFLTSPVQHPTAICYKSFQISFKRILVGRALYRQKELSEAQGQWWPDVECVPKTTTILNFKCSWRLGRSIKLKWNCYIVRTFCYGLNHCYIIDRQELYYSLY